MRNTRLWKAISVLNIMRLSMYLGDGEILLLVQEEFVSISDNSHRTLFIASNVVAFC